MKTLEAGKRIAINNILFATDFSPHSNAALPYALAIAHQYGARLYGAHVLSSDDYLFVAPETWPAHVQREEQLQQEAVERLEEQLRGVPHQALSGVGDVWDALNQLIGEHDIDLLVIGSHGRTGARKLLMGSIAEKIFRRASCPVLTVGPNVVHQQKSVAEFDQILLATDFGEESLAAAAYAISLAQEHQARLSLLHVVAPSKAEQPHAGTMGSESNTDFLVRRLQELVPWDTELWCHPEYFIQSGPPAELILRFSGAHGVDLIVMGARPAHGVVSAVTHFAHTTAQHIVAHATCPVLTVRG
ncbi:MAG: universal stress protein [Terriglobales bacterium]|jgi:nucleotide-binding universal stress UspA family protein